MVLWWHWFALGALLLVIDIALVNVYFLIWFGIGAMLVGLSTAVYADMPLWLQILAFSAFSAALLALWLRVLRPRRGRLGLAEARKQMPGLPATVIRFAKGKGTLRLQRPVGGRDVWEFASASAHQTGEQLVVDSVSEAGIVSASPRDRGEKGPNPQ